MLVRSGGVRQQQQEEAPHVQQHLHDGGRVRHGSMHIGFVPVLDAAPLIVAYELGYFREEGVRVALDRQIGWANVRDKLTYGHLDASHALVGMAVASAMGVDRFAEPLVSVAALGCGGDAAPCTTPAAARELGGGQPSPRSELTVVQ